MRIEPATMEDLDVITDQWVALAREQRQYRSHLLPSANREVMRMTIASSISEGNVLVAREGGVLGFVMFGVDEGSLVEDDDRGTVHNLYVAPEDRNAGVGSALLDAAEAALDEAGVAVVRIEAMAENDGAQRLYRRQGYRRHRVTYERRVESDTHSSEAE